MATKEPRALPTAVQIDVTDYKLGSARSDIDSFLTDVRSNLEIVSTEEALALIASGEAFPDGPDLDPDQLARLIVFATDVIDDGEALTHDGRELLEQARSLYNEHSEGSRNPGRFARSKRSIRAWHEQEAARGEAAS